MTTEKTTETTGPQQLRPVYYEPDHDAEVSNIVAAILRIRGYEITSDESMLDSPCWAVMRDGRGELLITNGPTTEALPEVETFSLPLTYANAIADWFDARSAEVQQGDLDDLPGTYTLDDGHPGSYDHEAEVSVQADATVTVTCTCGEWERTGAVRFGDEADTAVLAEWEAHVYQATGRSDTDRTCALGSCNRPPRPGSRHCSYGHNVATANRGGDVR